MLRNLTHAGVIVVSPFAVAVNMYVCPFFRMDSFVLAETFKYLYLLFADPADLVLDLDEFLFTTEAHLLPLSLARSSNYTVVTVSNMTQFFVQS